VETAKEGQAWAWVELAWAWVEMAWAWVETA
jgi:hypothetical protein